MIRTNPKLLTIIDNWLQNRPEEIGHRSFAAGERLVFQDEQIRFVYIMQSGLAKCFITEENGRDYILEFFGEGEIMGELELITGKGSLSNVAAITDLTAYRVRASFFTEELAGNRELGQLIMEQLAIRLERTAMRASYQQIYPLEYNLLRLLHLSSEQELQLSKQDIADYLAISTRSLNRALKELRTRNIINPDSFNTIISKEQLAQVLHEFDRLI